MIVYILISTERKKRKSKWDQTTPESVANTGGVDASVSAAAAAARINAKLEAEGKLQRPVVNIQLSGWSFIFMGNGLGHSNV